MKICIFTHSFPRFDGDTATPFMGNIANALGELGHDIYILTPFDQLMKVKNRGPFKIIQYKYIFPDKLHILGYSRTFKEGKGLNILTYLLSPFMYLFGLLALVRLIKKEKIDIISAHWTVPSGFIAFFAKLFTKVPYTASIPGADVHMGGQNELFRQMVGVAVRFADYVISDSKHYIIQLNELGFYPKLVSILRYGVNPKVFKPLAKSSDLLKKLGIKSSDKIVLAVGRFVVQKGYVYLVKAFSIVAKKVPSARLIIVGDGYEKSKLEAEAKKGNILDKVIFPGTISYDQLIKFYNLADAFAMPSIKDKDGNLDASPVAMMEAMSCGVPVVATRFSGNEDLVIKGKTGYLVKEKNSEEIAHALTSLLNKKGKTKIQKEVRAIAINNFSVQQIAKNYIKIFQEILQPKK